jgi:hypothetical protein
MSQNLLWQQVGMKLFVVDMLILVGIKFERRGY